MTNKKRNIKEPWTLQPRKNKSKESTNFLNASGDFLCLPEKPTPPEDFFHKIEPKAELIIKKIFRFVVLKVIVKKFDRNNCLFKSNQLKRFALYEKDKNL